MSGKNYRIEKDSMGEVRVAKDALYGAQTQRAIENFPVSGQPLPPPFIHAVALIKKTAAEVNMTLALLAPEMATAIIQAAEDVMAAKHDDQFPVDVFQTGSGTSTNMNVNEVVAALASRTAGKPVHPNDHVNMGQSSNDVIPTAIHLSAVLQIERVFFPAQEHLAGVIEKKAMVFSSVIKTGRTHLMDAMPLSIEQELSGWASQVRHGMERIKDTLTRVRGIAQGGTAVGTGINAHPEFALLFAEKLSDNTGLKFYPNRSFFESISSQDASVELSGQLKTFSVTLMKIANDLRWMNSGPLGGLGEIALPALQPGSSIMPGKVNPVIPESVAMVAAQVIGLDTAITVAAQSGNFQLNVMLPLIASNLLTAIKILSGAGRILADRAIADFAVKHQTLQETLAKNPILITALNPVIGYNRAAEIAKEAYRSGRPILDVALEMTDLSEEKLQALLDPSNLV